MKQIQKTIHKNDPLGVAYTLVNFISWEMRQKLALRSVKSVTASWLMISFENMDDIDRDDILVSTGRRKVL